MDQLFLLFLIFPGLLYLGIGFIYHYYRNKNYSNVIIESIVIGLVFGYFIQVDGIGWLEWTLISILLVFSGGILALKIRGSSNLKSPGSAEIGDKDYKKDHESDIGKINDKIYVKPEKNENIEDKILKPPVKNRNRIKTFNEVLPFTPPEEVKLYPYNIKNSFKKFRSITVRSDKFLESTEAMEDVNKKLKQEASNLGANAVIRVRYEQGILTLFRGIRGVGLAVSIKDLENVEKTYPPGTVFYMVMGFFWLTMGLLSFNDYRQFYIPLGLVMVIYGVFTRRGYINKTFFLAFLGIIIVNGLILGRYILKNGIQLFNFEFYFGTGFFAMILVLFVYSYKRRKNDPNILWKDQWGFK